MVPARKVEPSVSAIDRVKFMIVRAFLYAWARCFSLKGLYLFGRFFGFCEWMINLRRRRRFYARLRHIYGGDITKKELQSHCLQYFQRVRCDKLYYLIFDKLPKEKILKRIKFHDREVLHEALSHNKGVFVALSHCGSHHVAGLLMALLGYKIAGVRDRNEGSLRRYVQERYAETFPEIRAIKLFFADAFPRDLFRCFEEGYVVASAMDVDRTRGKHLKTAPVRIYGHERPFLTGPLQIAMRRGAPVIQGFVISKKNFYFHLVPKPLLGPGSGEKEDPELLAQTLQNYAGNIEQHVREYPDHISRI
jgi:lauroyl/myristoyl acyltransferase